MDEPKPVFLLTGFLGAGKTTLLNRLLKRPCFANTLVIVNEFGEVGLDHHLVEASSDTILELSNGCLCCSVRGELVDTLLGLDSNRFERVIIETTGIADPVPVFQSLAAHPDLVKRFKPASILSVVDAARGMAPLKDHREARQQLAVADLIFLSKTELSDADLGTLKDAITAANPHAQVLTSDDGLTPDQLTSPEPQAVSFSGTVGHSHATGYASQVLTTNKTLDIHLVAGLLHHLANAIGPDLLRIKGTVKVREHPDKPLIVQVSGTIVHDFQSLDRWPENHSDTSLVLITKNAVPTIAASIFDGYVGNAAIDTPDRDALTDNPLAVPGVSF